MNNLEKYYNPIFHRENIMDLCGEWDFSFDGENYVKINVPYCPESKLSGLEHKGFIDRCYYRRLFHLSENRSKVFLCFGAVDYKCLVYVNGVLVKEHVGGYTPFECDISDVVTIGENTLELQVYDCVYLHSATGKQSFKLNSFGCFYTRTTGIWQPVYLEFRNELYVSSVRFFPNVDDQNVDVEINTTGVGDCSVEVLFQEDVVGAYKGKVDKNARFNIDLAQKHLWSIGQGDLYDVKITFEGDIVYSYFGLRRIEYDGYDFKLNGERVYQRMVLEQGFNQDGIYTEPNVAFMEKDIRSALALGFNGLRLHQKLFDPRYLYLCDKLGVMVWGEYASWGVDYSNLSELDQFLAEWKEAMDRDFNHPCIVTWCPLNEVWDNWFDSTIKRDVRFVDAVYGATKCADKTRPCVDVSGGHHGTKTDLFDFHCYEDTTILKAYLDELENDDKLSVKLLFCEGEGHNYPTGCPVNISELGGFSFGNVVSETSCVNVEAVQNETAWGYGKGVNDGDSFVKRYKELMDTIKGYKKISGFCYTQLYDVEQEQNGFYYYDRRDKLTEAQKRAIKMINESIK